MQLSSLLADEPTSNPSVKPWKESGWALVQRLCLDCHNQEFQEAELDLSSMQDEASAPANAVMWNRVLQMVRFGAMPPDDSELPTDQERRELVDAIERAIYKHDCDLRPKAGRVTARRLNRAEYANTVRDLFAIQFDVAEFFPSDEVGGGFDNNADVLSMPPMLLEKYVEAAEKISTAAILDPKDLTSTEQERSGDGIAVVGDSVTESFYGRILKDDAFAWVEFEIGQSGKYRLRVSGGAWNNEKTKQAYAVYDRSGQPLYAGIFDKIDDGGSHSATFSRDLEAGKHFFIIAPLESLPEDFDKDRPEKLGTFTAIDKLDEQAIAAGREQFGKALSVDRGTQRESHNLMVRRISIEGPTEFTKSQYPDSHFEILKRIPESRGGRYRNVDEAARACLKPLLERVFRGPVDDETVNRYVSLVQQATDRDQSFQKGMRVALTAALVSPRFLFRVELPADNVKPDANGQYALTSVQLASRLSYFLWSSTPDETLLKLAREGNLDNEKELKRQVQRMLADPRAHSLATEFAAQWLGLRILDGIDRDRDRFPEFDATLVSAMRTETEKVFSYVLRENLPAGELLTADYSFLNEPLAKLYGVPFSKSEDQASEDGFQKVSLAATQRRGVLTHGSVLTLTSYPTRTSPVQRGKWILENVLGLPAPEPPPNVPELEATKAAEGASVREQLALHRENPSCASCHKVMDQLGFGFEQFDAIGRFKDEGNIDASGELPGGRIFEGGEQLAKLLRQTESARFAGTVAQKLLGFALGRELSPDDRCVIDKMVADNQKTDYRLADLVTSVVLSRPFQYFQPEPPAGN